MNVLVRLPWRAISRTTSWPPGLPTIATESAYTDFYV